MNKNEALLRGRPKNLSRRQVLVGAVATSIVVFSYTPARADGSAAQGSFGPADFLALSERLTGRRRLNPGLSARAYAALTAEDGAFTGQAALLAETLAGEDVRDPAHLAAFIERHPELRPVAQAIISAWYLGYTGTPAMHAMEDDARFVAYAGALMYEPTSDATVIPSYARGRTNYWSNPPSSIATD